MSQTTMPDVLTLEEAAAYLRLPVETITRLAAQGGIPARKIEDTWRFLKAAVDDWLRSHDTLPAQRDGASTNGPNNWTLAERRAFMKLPLEERRQRLATQAERAVAIYESEPETTDRMEWQGGDIVEP